MSANQVTQIKWTNSKKKQIKLTEEEKENLNRAIISKKIELVIKSLPIENSPGPDAFTRESYQKKFFFN